MELTPFILQAGRPCPTHADLALALAAVCVEAARRAGIALGVVAGGAGCYVAHPLLDEPLLVDVGRGGRVVEAGGRTDDVGWQCSPPVAARILNRIRAR